jgi:hypothetical protein
MTEGRKLGRSVMILGPQMHDMLEAAVKEDGWTADDPLPALYITGRAGGPIVAAWPVDALPSSVTKEAREIIKADAESIARMTAKQEDRDTRVQTQFQKTQKRILALTNILMVVMMATFIPLSIFSSASDIRRFIQVHLPALQTSFGGIDPIGLLSAATAVLGVIVATIAFASNAKHIWRGERK